MNALSLPDGSLYINSGLILAADEEAELAGAMAHAIAHIAACHAGRTWSSIEGGSADPWLPIIPKIGGIDGAAGMFGIARFPRGFEAEADYLGVEYMDRAGYDPPALVSYLEKISAMEKPPWSTGSVAMAFVTHPLNIDRAEKAEKEIRTLLPAELEYLVTTSDFEQVKARLAANREQAPVKSKEDPSAPLVKQGVWDERSCS